MRTYRRTVRAVLAALAAAGTAFFIPAASAGADGPVSSFYLSPSPFSLSLHGGGDFYVGLNDEYDMDVEIRVYTPAGEPVRTILAPDTPQGTVTPVHWDGKNDHGRAVKPGGYLCKLLATPSAGDGNKYSKTATIGVLP